MATFADAAIASFLSQKLEAMGLSEPTDIQAQALPLILEGRDVILQSQTGTGKTLAYLLPVLSRIQADSPLLQAIVIAPTRELGMQIVRVISQLIEGQAIVAQQLIGGANIRHQVDRLKKHPRIVVGTPGRLAELIRMGKLKTHAVRMLVVDEVDHVLAPAFKADLIRVLKAVSRDRQTLFATATVTPEVTTVAERWMKEAVHVQVAPESQLPTSLHHAFLEVDPRHKSDAFRKLVHAAAPRAAIAFVNDPARSSELVSKLAYKGLAVASLVGDAKKQDRADVLKALRDGSVQVLVATEVAARGLDFPELSHVFNYDLPTDAAHYLHRAGRTGRMGRPGMVVSLATPAERFVVDKFAKALGITIAPIQLDQGTLVSAPPAPLPQLDPRSDSADTEGSLISNGAES